jgi:amino-acid N-acetyltransferase
MSPAGPAVYSVAEFLDLAHVKPNTLGNTRMLKHL